MSEQSWLSLFLPFRLNGVADAMSRRVSRIYADRHAMTRPEWRVLAIMGETESVTATALGRRSTMHKTKVSRAVASLEKRRWLVRERSTEDRRVELLSLTRQGRRSYRDLVPALEAAEADMLASLTGAQVAQIREALDMLEDALGLGAPERPGRSRPGR